MHVQGCSRFFDEGWRAVSGSQAAANGAALRLRIRRCPAGCTRGADAAGLRCRTAVPRRRCFRLWSAAAEHRQHEGYSQLLGQVCAVPSRSCADDSKGCFCWADLAYRCNRRPALPTPEFTEWTEPTRAAVERRFGPQIVADHDAVGQQAQIILGFNREIASDWSAFPLLDGRLGGASAEDRANVRLAAARALTQLKMQRFKVIEIGRVGSRYSIAPSAADMNDYRSITDNCGLLKNW